MCDGGLAHSAARREPVFHALSLVGRGDLLEHDHKPGAQPRLPVDGADHVEDGERLATPEPIRPDQAVQSLDSVFPPGRPLPTPTVHRLLYQAHRRPLLQENPVQHGPHSLAQVRGLPGLVRARLADQSQPDSSVSTVDTGERREGGVLPIRERGHFHQHDDPGGRHLQRESQLDRSVGRGGSHREHLLEIECADSQRAGVDSHGGLLHQHGLSHLEGHRSRKQVQYHQQAVQPSARPQLSRHFLPTAQNHQKTSPTSSRSQSSRGAQRVHTRYRLFQRQSHPRINPAIE